MDAVHDLGVISDLQSGGWSYTLLTAKGALYTVGVLNGLQYRHRSHPSPHALQFPVELPRPEYSYDSRTAMRQFSSGRGHILAVSDSGRIWSWSNIDHHAVNVKFLDHNIVENGKQNGRSVVKKVVAGWNKSAALIEGTGIVVWEPLDSDSEDRNQTDAAQVIDGRVTSRADAALVLESAVILKTNEVDSRRLKSTTTAETQDSIGEVQSFIVLGDSIIFNTSLGRVFASLITWTEDRKTLSEPVELPIPGQAFITDVQGTFQNFAIFLKSGEVLTSTQDKLMPYLTGGRSDRTLWTRIPALQNHGVIALAFGDYHFHALHSAGHITSYGYEPQACGALGLGSARLRGLRNDGMSGDGHLVPHAYTEGRRVWFETAKREWLEFLAKGGVDREEAERRVQMTVARDQDSGCQGEVSEWIEQEARNWNEKYALDAGDDGLGAYFALGVTAAGWHSGALVLVNDELVEKLDNAVSKEEPIVETAPEASGSTNQHEGTATTLWETAAEFTRRQFGMSSSETSPSGHEAAEDDERVEKRYIWEQDSFPRLRLSDGREMPSDDENRGFDEWAFGRPEWQFGWESGIDLD